VWNVQLAVNRTNEREERFEALVATVYEPVQRYLGRRVGPDDASEVLNDVLLVLWRRLDDVPPVEPLPWVYGVAKRTLANQRRGDGRRNRLVGRIGGQARADSHDPRVWTGEAETVLDNALTELVESERELIRLWAWEQLEPREIAVVLDTNPNAISLRLTRAKKKLADSIERQDRASAGHKVDGHRKEHRS
jgi:RNA polymerase sigma-70 factor (ECF subfamily)